MAATRFSILVLCTGNICRSPAVERLLRRSLTPDSEVEVASAGAAALVGQPIDPSMAELMRAEGADVDDFAARDMTAEMVEQADLVLAATRWHRSAVVQLSPPSVRRAFTLREFGRLCWSADELLAGAPPTAGPAERLAALVAVAPSFRGREPVRKASEDDVLDPYGASRRVFAKTFAQLVPSVAAVVRAAGLPRPGSTEVRPDPRVHR